jgi:tetratricopeptide (TPR) repeat protein
MGHFFTQKRVHEGRDRALFHIVLAPAVVFLALTLPPASVGAGISFGQSGASTSSADQELSEIDTLIETNHLREAQELLQKEIHARGESYEILFREAKLLFGEKRYRDSLSVLKRCLALTQEDPEVYKLVASNAILIDRMDIAETALKSAAKLAPNDYLVFFNLGALYYTDSRFPQARPPLEKSLKLNTDYVPARLFLGLTLEELGQEPKAIECYHLAIKAAETSGFKGEQPYLYLGRLLYRENRMDECLPYLQKAVEANPRSCEALCLLAKVHMSRSRDAEANEALSQCRQADPQYPESHYLLSRIYVRQGKVDEAAKELSMFQQLKRVELDNKDPRKNQRAMP